MKSIYSKSQGGHLLNSGGVGKRRKSRGMGLRTRHGCEACRKGHVKCDEVHPQCGRCRKTNRRCDYTSNLRNESSDQQESQVSVALPHGQLSCLRSSQASFSSNVVPDSWPATWMLVDDELPNSGPQSDYGTGSASPSSLNSNISSLDILEDTGGHQFDNPCQSSYLAGESSPLTQVHTTGISPTSVNCHKFPVEGTRPLQACGELQLTAEDRDCYRQYMKGVGQWIDLFDPYKHFSSFVPQLAKQNMGLLKAILALGAQQLSRKEGARYYGLLSSKYRTEAEDHLRMAMKSPLPVNSSGVWDTVLLLSQHEELATGVAKGYKNRMCEIFKVGSFPLEITQVWLRQEVWAAYRERRKCVSFFKPSNPSPGMDPWDWASVVVSFLAQSIDYRSDQGRRRGAEYRVSRGNNLMVKLDNWFRKKSIQFDPVPVDEPSTEPFQPLTMSLPALGNSIQMYCVAKIFILADIQAVGDIQEDSVISDCIDTTVGIALNLTDAANIVASVQCVFMAGRYCCSEPKREAIADLLNRHQTLVGWPPKSINLAKELRAEWSEMDTVSASTLI